MLINSEDQKILKVAEMAMKEAIKLYKNKFLKNLKIESTIGKDIKTSADYEISELLIKELKKTNLPVISEESREEDLVNIPNVNYWLIDPLDGTFNLERGFPIAAISIALMNNKNIPIAGIVYHIGYDQLFISYKNNNIKVSETSKINQAVVATGFPSARDYSNDSLKATIKNIQKFKKVRMLGSATCMILEVARGIFDVYVEEDIYLWDVSGALAILQSAGGKYYLKQGSSIWKFNVIASNAKLNI